MSEDLEPGELLLTHPAELLFRQATTPLWDPASRQPSSLAFGPSTADQGKPSFSRSSKVTAQESRDWHQRNAHSLSHGVWACSVDIVIATQLRAIDVSGTPGPKAPGHAYVDYRGMTKKEERKARALLLAEALARGEIPTT